MTLERVRAWFERLPPAERDLPIIILEGVAYTPRMILAEVSRGTPLGERLQAMVETGRLGTTMAEVESLAKLRLKELLSRLPPDKPIVATLGIPEKTYTPRELLREIEMQTEAGRQWVEAEIRTMRRVLEMARR